VKILLALAVFPTNLWIAYTLRGFLLTWLAGVRSDIALVIVAVVATLLASIVSITIMKYIASLTS
jgi:hypothetical protein